MNLPHWKEKGGVKLESKNTKIYFGIQTRAMERRSS
jgi:hypothetical protein